MFASKRQQRKQQLRKLSQKQWEALPAFLILHDAHFVECNDECGGAVMLEGSKLAAKARDRKFRDHARRIWLDHAEESLDFCKLFDRFLNLRTDQEDREYHEHWATKRNKVYVWFACLAFAVSIASLIISIVALRKSG